MLVQLKEGERATFSLMSSFEVVLHGSITNLLLDVKYLRKLWLSAVFTQLLFVTTYKDCASLVKEHSVFKSTELSALLTWRASR